ncbi:unnamed protein product [Ectocarpus sp. 12 AP-2014]
MVELWISLIRNAACVLKSLLPAEYTVMQPLMAFPFPLFWSGGGAGKLEMFTGLEGLIGVLQLAGAGFNLCKGAKGLAGGVVMAEYIVRWRNALAEYGMGVEGKARGVAALSAVLKRQDAANNRRIIAGICQLVIGTGLVCLTCFSWKLVGIMTTATVVAVLEVALAVLLTIGVTGVLRMWAISNKVQRLQQKPPAEAPPDADVVELVAPRSGRDMGGKWEPDVRVPPTVATLREHMEGMSSIEKAVSSSPLEDYQAIGQAAKKQAVLDAFLISLNVAAFVGYGAIPLDVFFPQRSLLTTWLPPGPTAWWGNFVGDVAWTIEPITVFLAPYLVLRRAQPGKTKTS